MEILNKMIQDITVNHQQELIKLLSKASLPTTDIDLNKHTYLGYFMDNCLLGAIGMEKYAEGVLLRSLVVSPKHQGMGIGRNLVNELEKKAGTDQIYLLTETAETFFGKLNYQKINREDVPISVRQSYEFTDLCPTSAICMTLNLSK